MSDLKVGPPRNSRKGNRLKACPTSRRQPLAFGFFSEWNERQPHHECERHHGHGNAEGLEVAYAGADQERESRGEEAAEIGDEGERARAALGAVLLGQPERVDDEVRAAEAKEC